MLRVLCRRFAERTSGLAIGERVTKMISSMYIRPCSVISVFGFPLQNFSRAFNALCMWLQLNYTQTGGPICKCFLSFASLLHLHLHPPHSFISFRAIPHQNKYWVSLSPMKDKQSFTLLNTSYKEFKTNFIKVAIKEPDQLSFYLDNGQPKFPFYWAEHPKRVFLGLSLP